MSVIVPSLTNSDAEAEEWRLRCDMAAVFRVCARLGWNEQIGNHNSVLLPGEEPTFLINPRGRRFEELTASSLIVCSLDGRVLRGDGELRKVAFYIHARIHLNKPDAVCLLHVHPQYLTSLSMLADPTFALAHQNNLMLNDRAAYDLDFEGPADNDDEGDRLAGVMGDKTILMMGSHGVSVAGRTVEEAFDELHSAERTAMYQVTAMSTGRPLAVLPEKSRRRYNGPWGEQVDARMHLDAWRRILDKEGSDYAT
jgi:ribulose-5-phosphate 4-epimerase/fuculose-1-phosphate aldolase